MLCLSLFLLRTEVGESPDPILWTLGRKAGQPGLLFRGGQHIWLGKNGLDIFPSLLKWVSPVYKLNKVLEGEQIKKKKPGMRRCPVPVPGAGVEGKGKEEVKTECPMSQDKWDRSQWWWHRTGGWPRSHNDGEITDLWLNSGGGSLGEVEQIIYSWELWQVPAIPTRGSRRASLTSSEKQKKRKKEVCFRIWSVS